MNYAKRDNELIKLNKHVQEQKNAATNKSLASQKKGTYGSTKKELPYVKASAPNKASEMTTTGNKTTKPSTRYQNQTAGQTTPSKARDTRYDNDFNDFYEYRYNHADMMDYDPVTETSTEHWRNVKADLMKKHNWTSEEFDKRFEAYDTERSRKESNKEVEGMKELGKSNPALATLLQFGLTPQTWIEGGGTMLQSVLPNKYKAQSADDAMLTGTRAKAAAKQSVKDEHIKSGLGKGVYDVGTSVADMAASMGAGGLAPMLMAMPNASGTQMQALERGTTAGKAAATGAIAGGIGTVMNAIGLDKAAGAAGKTALGKVVKGAGIEAAENMLEDSANLAVDTLINKDKSQLNALHDYYTSQGMSDSEAWNRVRLDTLGDMAVSGASGAMFGGAMNAARNLPSLIPELRDLTKGYTLNDVGGIDTSLIEEAKNNLPAPAKVNPREVTPLGDEEINSIKTRREQIKTEKAVWEDRLAEYGDKRNKKALRTEAEAKIKELKKEDESLKKQLSNKPATIKELLKQDYPTMHKDIFNWKGDESTFGRIDNIVKYAGDTPEAKEYGKTIKKALNDLLETGDEKAFWNNHEFSKAVNGLDAMAREANIIPFGDYSYTDRYGDNGIWSFLIDEGDLGSIKQISDYMNAKYPLPQNGKSAPTNIKPTPDTQPNNITDEIKDYRNRRAELLSDIANNEHTVGEYGSLYRQIGDLDEEMIQKHPELFDADGNLKEDGTAKPTPEQPVNNVPLTPEDQAELQRELKETVGDWSKPVKNTPAEPPVNNIPPTNNVPPTEPPLTSEPPRTDKIGKSLVGLDTAVNSNVFTKDQINNHPVISKMNEYAKASNDLTYNQAKEDVIKDGDTLLEEYTSGRREIKNDLDVDRSMIMLTELSERVRSGETNLEAKRNLLFSRLRRAGTLYGQTIQAFKKWNRTAEGAIANGEGIIGDRVKAWKSNNVKKTELNGRIAKALEQMGVDSSMRNKTPQEKTHAQVKEGVKNVLAREFGSIEQYFNDNDLEYLARLAEDKSVPIWKIVDEIEHKLSTGEWYTLDESTPVKKAFSSKLNTVLKNMGDDRLKEANRPLDNGYGKSHATIVEEVRNSLEKEMAGVGLDKPADIEFLATMIEEGVPNWQIEDEIRHRLETGEWYSLDEAIEPKYPINQRLKNALDSLVNTEPAPVKEPPSLDEIRNQVRETLDKEIANRRGTGEFTDEDVEYLANLINEGATKDELADALNTKMATGNFGISAETQQTVSDLFRYANNFDPDSKKAFDLRTTAYKLIANEAVSDDATAFEKFDSWRYLAMLGNPKTWVRNKVGNEMFNAVTGVSNNISAALEAATDKAYKALGGEGIQRTKTFLNPVDDRALIKAAAEDGDNYRYSVLNGTKYERGIKDAIKQQKSVFNNKALRAFEAVTDWGISDYKNVKRKYGTSLAGYMKANGLDESAFDADARYRDLKDKSRTQLLTDAEKAEMNTLKSVHDDLEKARDYAVKQAEYATFHEDNKLASWLSKSSKDAPGVGRLVIEGLVPFKKTPANILRSGFEYSPFGAIKSIKETGKLVYENTGKRKGNLEDTYKKKNLRGETVDVNKSLASDVLDSWSKTLTGSGLMALGYYLKNKGVLNSSTDDEKWQDDLEGKQNYSITINGKTYTVDWAAPAIMPMLIGAELSKIKDRYALSDEKFYENIDDIADSVNAILDPLIETSMLQNVKSSLEELSKVNKYSDDTETFGGAIGAALMNAGTGYLTQAIPTVSGQIARTVDNTRRTTDTATDSTVFAPIEKQGRKVMNKIPGLSFLNTPYYDSYGRTQNQGFDNPIGRLLYQTLSPAYIRSINVTPADEQAREVYNATQNKDVFPSWKSTKKVNGEKLNPQEMATYRKASGEAQYAIRDALAKEEWFKGLETDEQEKILKKVNTLVDKIGLEEAGYPQDSKDLAAYQEGGIEGAFFRWGKPEYGVPAVTETKTATTTKTEPVQQTTKTTTPAKTNTQQTTAKSETVKVDTAKQQKYIDRAGRQSRKYTNDLPKLEQLNFSSAEKYTYAYAINQDGSLTPEKFDAQFDKMDLDNSGSMKQDEMIEYFNRNNISQEQGQYLWKTYGDRNGEPWKTLPVLKNGTWKKKK